jgi:tetratricopeptide (TPR) repeat protein
VLAAALLRPAGAQQAAPPRGETAPRVSWLARGEELLLREDPVGAWRAFTSAWQDGDRGVDCRLGLGRVHLMLGRASEALGEAEAALAAAPRHQSVMALQIAAQIRARDFEGAARTAERHLRAVDGPGSDLLAAQGSAWFRLQRIDEAAEAYRLVVGLDREHAEANLRLGSGLLPPTEVRVGAELRAAVAASRDGELDRAIQRLLAVLVREPGNPIAHRLLGEALFTRKYRLSMAATDDAFVRLRAAMPTPQVRGLPIAEFVMGYAQLDADRRAVVDAAVGLFASRLPKLVAVGATHDLLHELDRTTDADARANLRGRRTFDGRVWDDVRGIGGLTAATGIEALDEAMQFGFDTLAHEIAHQVHFYAMNQVQRVQIKTLYRRALDGNHCLDFYAASNEAEYFGQGVEAFRSLAKRPGSETTHGHTRFELFRVDQALHDFIAGLVDFDPLAGPNREELLRAAHAVALRVGRLEDARTAAEWVEDLQERVRLLAEIETASAAAATPSGAPR